MSQLQTKLLARLETLAGQWREVEEQLLDPAVVSDPHRLRSVSIQRAALEPMVAAYDRWKSLQKRMAENRELMVAGDSEMAELARGEIPSLEQEAQEILDRVTRELITAQDRAVGSVILEIRAGAGGAEAALWAGDLLAMYQHYAVDQRWEFDVLDLSPGEMGGVRSATIQMAGAGVWQGMGYEGGVHCVKRVPATETQGRIHTSTATVAVLPEPEKVQIDIPDSDVKMDITTAQGPGGQNVNKVATAVKMVHIPTGIEVRMQESKSQQQNRAKAWQLLRARVYDHYQKQKDAQRAEKRSAMIGSADRSERIRTYRYKESIVVDHRLEQLSFNLSSILQGRLTPLIAALIQQDCAQRLAAL